MILDDTETLLEMSGQVSIGIAGDSVHLLVNLVDPVVYQHYILGVSIYYMIRL